MKRKIVIGATSIFILLAIVFALTGATPTGLVVAETTQDIQVNHIFSAIFLFLGLATFIVGILHE